MTRESPIGNIPIVACLTVEELARYAGGDPELTGLGEMHAHVEACADCQANVAGALRATRESIVGTTLQDRYVIESVLGSGGMGTVYLARDLSLERQVALKLHKRGISHDRLWREAVAMAKLAHPNVVSVFEVGKVDERVFVAMEYVRGQTLTTVAASRSWREIVELLVAAGEGLAAVHRAGLVHRDFKPDNVLVGEDGRARVSDFGIARAELEPDGGTQVTLGSLDTPMTQTGAIVGTPAYMAPEQLAGGKADARSDQFSFCVAAWQALFRVRPFSGASVAQLMRQITQNPITLPRRTEVPARVRAVLARGLAARPEQRHADMPALLAALRRTMRSRTWWYVAAGVAAAATAFGTYRVVHTDDPCALDRTRLASVWNADRSQAAASLGTIRDRIDARAAAWRAGYTMQCHVDAPTWPRMRTCFDSILDEIDVVADVASHVPAAALRDPYDPMTMFGNPALCGRADMPSPTTLPPAGRAHAIAAYKATLGAAAARRVGDTERARTTIETALAEATQSGWLSIEARVRGEQARIAADRGDPAAATTLAQAIGAAERAGAPHTLAMIGLDQASVTCRRSLALNSQDCRGEIARLRSLVDVLGDPWLRLSLDQIAAFDLQGDALLAERRRIADAWKQVPGAQVRARSASRWLALTLLNTKHPQQALDLYGLLVKGVEDPPTTLDAQAIVEYGYSLVVTGELADGKRQLARARGAVSHMSVPRLQAKLHEVEVDFAAVAYDGNALLSLIPSDGDDPLDQILRYEGLVILRRWDEADRLRMQLRSPIVWNSLDPSNRNQLGQWEVFEALDRQRVAEARQLFDHLSDADPYMRALVLEAEGHHAAAMDVLRNAHDDAHMGATVQAALDDGRLADAEAVQAKLRVVCGPQGSCDAVAARDAQLAVASGDRRACDALRKAKTWLEEHWIDAVAGERARVVALLAKSCR